MRPEFLTKELGDVRIECVKGNIILQGDIVAIVNSANAQLRPGGGVSGAIHSAAGPELTKECQRLAPIKPGEAVITNGYRLPNRYVLHCLGPIYGLNKPEDEILADCYRNVLKLAEKYKIESIAFPAISTGTFGYPVAEAADVALKTIIEMIPQLKHIKKIRFVLYSERDFAIYKEKLSAIRE